MVPDPEGFGTPGWWRRQREQLLFRSAAERDAWLRRCLRRVLARYGVGSFDDLPLLRTLPEPIDSIPHDAITLQTSGTLSSHRRQYHYQRPQFGAIQVHHWWRVERELGTEQPGRVVGVAYNPFYAKSEDGFCQVDRFSKLPELGRPLDRPETHLYGPSVLLAVGGHNQYHEWTYSRHTTPDDWRTFWRMMHTFRPKLLLMAPSQLQAAWPSIRDMKPLPCPVVMTTEMLDRPTRAMAAALFTCVLDKMRCWDGGLGFVECRAGRLHCYDELAYIEKVNGVLASTDPFNFVHPFFRYANGDDADLGDGLCDCGIFGRYFAAFRGRICQRIMLGGAPFPGTALAEEIGNFLYFGALPSFLATAELRRRYGSHPLLSHVRWQLRQLCSGNFEFRYDADLDSRQLEYLDLGVRFIVLREGDLPAGDLEARRAGGHGLALIRRADLGDGLKTLSVISDIPPG